MLAANKAKGRFAHARALHADAMQSLTAGDVRNAAGKAWDATLAATNALILARTGKSPEKITDTSGALDELARQYPAVKTLVGRYCARLSHLYGDCFYSGILDYPDIIERRIRKTADYIQDAETLALAKIESAANQD